MQEPVELEPTAVSRDELLAHIAVHEAGHAVIGVASGFALVRVSIGSSWPSPSKGLILGGTEFDAPDGDQNQLAKQDPEKMAVVLFAGVVAEQAVLRAYVKDGWVEDQRIMRIGLGWTDSITDSPRQTAFAGFLKEAKRLVQDNVDWVRRVGVALLDERSLAQDQVERLR